MLNQKTSGFKSLFFSSKETWWLIGFSMIISGGMLTIPQIITSFVVKGNLEGMWIIWAGFLGTAFGKAFFAHLWHRVPVKTENELILYRFSGRGSKILHAFRSLYVGGIIAPLGLSMVFLAFGRIVSFTLGCSVNAGILFSLGFVVVATFFNSLRQRLRLDTIYLAILVVSLIVIVYFILINIGSLNDLQLKINQSNLGYRLFPQMGSRAFTAFLVFFLVQWWSASIIDFPNITGQKLMSAGSMNAITRSIVLPSLMFSVFTLIIISIPLFIILTDITQLTSTNGEEAFLQIFLHAIPKQYHFVVLIFFLLPFVAATNNTQNWSGSLLIQNFYIYYINKKTSEKKLKRMGIATMLAIAILAAFLALANQSMLDIIKFMFAITAGVGPVFILRWYWHRINAWSQLSAMVASLLYPNLMDLAYARIDVVTATINSAMNLLNLDYYPFKIVVLTIVVCLSWILVTFITKPTDGETIQRFAQTVKPGGIWKLPNIGSINFWKRLAVALLFVLASISFYAAYWQLISGKYAMLLLFSILFIIFTLTGYVVLKRINAKI